MATTRVSAGEPGTDLPRFAGDALPAPTKQDEPWAVPNTQLPDNVVAAARKLFDRGMADPRGCQYREIHIVIGDVWGQVRLIKSRGWVMPAGKEDRQQFAVAWNGLVYPVVSAGEPADYKADIAASIKADEAALAEAVKQGRGPTRFPSEAEPELATTDPQSLHPLRACLLLRLGDVVSAEEVWKTWLAGAPSGRVGSVRPIKDAPYEALAGDWEW
jgi:hypothetical protein